MMTKQVIIDSMRKNAKENGYYLCPDTQLFKDLINGLATNTGRYGYGSCPCRVASGIKKYDVDIICPCEYRDADVDEFGMCYCGLFVNKKIQQNPSQMGPIPERRPHEIMDAALAAAGGKPTKKDKTITGNKPGKKGQPIKVWRCTVCGYLCARETPPPICPICKAKAERFEPFTFG
ncbi:MAG TPA: ferredoxin-thioredoxin reductase catalytic domain-containing protein [Candidatus Thermoplasmatota archaeon]|nr:ferredoxin-thioredoxin reductase catalytic domain-containing protein [Candidatus Thermoplasmatota archaeon]